MSSYVNPKVSVGKGVHGTGLFADEPIKKDEVIVDFSTGPGKYVKSKEATHLYDAGADYMLQVDDDKYFAATSVDETEDADFINHSCDPNCGIQGSLKVVAMRDIKPKEEITFDYAMSESSRYEMPCACGAPHCRTKITGNDWKLPELQKRYKGYFSGYLEKKMRAKKKTK